MSRFVFVPALAVLAAACAPQPVDPGLSEQGQDAVELQRTLAALVSPPLVAGCSDLHVYASNASDGRALFLTVSGGVIEDAYDGGDTHLELALPHPDVALTVQWGSDLTINECNDVVLGTPVIDGEASAISGMVVIDLDLLATQPQPWDMSADATIILEDVVFETATGAQRTWSVDLGTTYVGWLPG
jgi:hypothetical protein